MMKKLSVISFVLLLSISGLLASDTDTPTVPTATLAIENVRGVYQNGDVVVLKGQNFPATSEIVIGILVVYNADGSTDLKPLRQGSYNLFGDGTLSGEVVLEGIDRDDQYAEILLSAKGTNVQSTRRFQVSGELEPFSNRKVTEGTFTFSEQSGDNVVQLNERLDVATSGTDWTPNPIAVVRREYSTNDGTGSPVANVGLDVSNMSISGGELSGFTNNGSTAYDGSTLTMRLSVMDGTFAFSDATNFFSTVDNVQPKLTSAVATSLDTIRLTFDEAVSEPGTDAHSKFVLSGAGVGTASPSSVVPVGTEPTTTWDLVMTGSLADRSAQNVTVSYDSTQAGGTLEDDAGNEVQSNRSATVVTDQIPPATPTLTSPINGDIFTTTVSLQATAESGTTDPSIDGVRFQGSNDGSSWTDLGTDTDTGDNTYAFTYNLGTKFAFYRAQAFDGTLTANSSSSPNFSDAHRIEITTFPATLDPGVRGQFTITIQNNYQDAVSFGSNLAFNLTTSQSTGTFFDQSSGGSQITQVVITSGNTSADFWYSDTDDNTTPTITVTESASNLDDPTDSQQITINQVLIDHFAVKTGNGENETAGVAFDVTVEAHDASHAVVTTYVGDHSLTWTTDATASPKGNSPVMPSNGTYTFSSGTVTVTNGATLFNSGETPFIRVTDENSTATDQTENAGMAVNVAVGAAAELRVKTADESVNGDYANNVFGDATFQGPTQADPDKTADLFGVMYDNFGNLRPDENCAWGTNGSLSGTFSANSVPNTTITFDNVTGTTTSGQVTAISLTSFKSGNTGTITVDDDDGATVTGFSVTTDNDDNRFVFATWNPNSSGDDGTTGSPSDFEIRWAPEGSGPINTEAEWDAATSVGTSGKPAFSVGTWRIDMSGFSAGNKYFAIRTFDDVGNISVLGTGAFTTSVDFSLPVTISVFQARGDYGKIVLEWETSSEINNEGFLIYRAESEEGNFVQINQQIIPGQGNTNQTYEYQYVDKNVEPEKTYYYKLFSRDFDGTLHEYSYLASAAALKVPETFSLAQNYPNPFNPSTNFRFAIARTAKASLVVYDVLGKKVKTIFSNQSFEPGVYDSFRWDARDDAGNSVANGIYYYVFQVPQFDFKQVRKMVYLR